MSNALIWTLGDWQREKARDWRCEWCGVRYQDQEPASWHLGLLDWVKHTYRLDLMSCVCTACVDQARAGLRPEPEVG